MLGDCDVTCVVMTQGVNSLFFYSPERLPEWVNSLLYYMEVSYLLETLSIPAQ